MRQVSFESVVTGNYIDNYSYLKEYQYDPEGDPATYIEALKNTEILQHESLIADGTDQGTEHIRHVAKTFNLSYQLLNTDEPVDKTARQLLAWATVFEAGNENATTAGRGLQCAQ